MFLRRQGEARRSTPFQPPRRCLGEYKARQGSAISVKKREKGGKIKGTKDKARIGKAARTPRVLARLDALKTRSTTMSCFEVDPAMMSYTENMNFLITQIAVMNEQQKKTYDQQTLILAEITTINGRLDSHDRRLARPEAKLSLPPFQPALSAINSSSTKLQLASPSPVKMETPAPHP
jgi:hypothetical protein